jgi:hypothetical protein
MPVEGGLRLPNSQSPCGFRPNSGQDHGIESEWVVFAIDIASQAVSRTPPMIGRHERRPYRHDELGFGLSWSMRRRMSANRSRGMATSAIWNVT